MSIEEYLLARMRDPEADLPAPAAVVMELRRRTGVGVLDAKRLLERAADSTWNERMVRALLAHANAAHANAERRLLLHDPIEDDPELGLLVAAADEQARRQLEDEPWRMGLCHRFWHTKQRILQEKYGIEWFTPAQMNPGSCFD